MLENPEALIEEKHQHLREDRHTKEYWDALTHLVDQSHDEKYLAHKNHSKYQTYSSFLGRAYIGAVLSLLFGSYVALFMEQSYLGLGMISCGYFMMMGSIISQGNPFFIKKIKHGFEGHGVAKVLGYGAIINCPSKQLYYQKLQDLYQQNQHNAYFWKKVVTLHHKYIKKSKPPLAQDVDLQNLSWNNDDIVFIAKDGGSSQEASTDPSSNQPPSFWV